MRSNHTTIDKVISYINTATVDFLKEYGIAANVHTIAEPIVIDEVGGVEQVRPAMVDQSGEIDSNMFDDTLPICFYHRLQSKTYTGIAKSGYGDHIHYTEVCDMSMIVFGVRSAISANELEQAIANAINTLQHHQGGVRVVGVVRNVSFDRRQILQSEYSGVPFFLQPNIFLFRINYQLTIAQPMCN